MQIPRSKASAHEPKRADPAPCPKGWRALVDTVNDAAVAERLITDGIEGIITGRPSPAA